MKKIITKVIVVIFITVLVLFSGCLNKLRESLPMGDVTNTGQVVIENVQDLAANETRIKEVKVDTAVKISKFVVENNFKKIDVKEIRNYSDYKDRVDNLNMVIESLNEHTRSNFKFLKKSTESYKRFTRQVEKYAPLIDNYNSFINSCYQLDPKNEESVDRFYIQGIIFAGEATLLSSGAFHKIAFSTTGALSRYLGLTKLSSICPYCVSIAMKTIYSFTKTLLIEKTNEIAGGIT